MSAKKTNPRRRPVTEADINAAKNRATRKAVEDSIAIVFTVLCDKCGYTIDEPQYVWKGVNELSDSIGQKRVSMADIKRTLREEYNIRFTQGGD